MNPVPAFIAALFAGYFLGYRVGYQVAQQEMAELPTWENAQREVAEMQ